MTDEPSFYDLFDKRKYAAKALSYECQSVATAPEGTRNPTLNKAAFALGQLVASGHLVHGDVWHALRDAARTCGLPDPEIEKTLASGLGAGAQQPRQVPDRGGAATVVDGEARPSLFERDVEAKSYDLRVLQAARDKVAGERDADSPGFDIGTVAEILARPADPENRVEGLIPWAASTLVVAAKKTGKTTFLLNLARCLLNGEEFLGTFPTRPLNGRVGFLNYEVTGAQLGRWAREAGVPEDRMIQVNLRGRRNPLRHSQDRLDLAAHLRAGGVEALLVDPFSRAYGGKSQNDAAEVSAWLVDLDTFARSEVGALDLVLAAHTGWEGERSRGSSELEGWPDVVLTMTRDRDARDRRYFAAEGRDVLVDEDRLAFDAATRTLTMSGAGSRRQAIAVQRGADLRAAVVEIVTEHPGLNTREVGDKLRDAGHGHQRGDVGRAASAAVQTGHLRAEQGPRNSVLYFPKPSVVPSSPDPSRRDRLSSPDPSYRGRDYSTTTQSTSSPELDEPVAR